MTKPSKFAHIVYRTRRFEQMLQWYEIVFGAKVQYQNPGLAFLTYDDEHHRFAFANMALFQPDGTDTERQGAFITAFRYRSITPIPTAIRWSFK